MSDDASERGFPLEQLERIDEVEAASFAALFAAAAPALGTGSAPLDEILVIWHPHEEEAGYSYLLNFHRASDPDGTFERGLAILRERGAPTIGVPIERRNEAWGTGARLAALGLSYESDELIWAGEIRAGERPAEPPMGFAFTTDGIDRAELARLINEAWGLPADHSRGTLYASGLSIPGWFVLGARSGGELAGVTMASFYGGVCYLKLAMVAPPYRGRGLQSYFIKRRIDEGLARGCDLAISETNDDNASPRNLQRAGLRPAIRRRVFSRRLR